MLVLLYAKYDTFFNDLQQKKNIPANENFIQSLIQSNTGRDSIISNLN